MAGELEGILKQLHSNISSNNHKTSQQLLTKAKIALLHHNALVPSSQSSPKVLELAQQTLELGALISIRLEDPPAFTRYYQQLQPFYSLPSDKYSALRKHSQRSKITGLYLLLLLSQGDYAGFHTLLEGLEVAADHSTRSLEEDDSIQYPIRLESWLMEGSYDRVWEETKSERVPSEEFAIFSNVRTLKAFGQFPQLTRRQILVNTIRAEVASCSERAYGSIPIANAKNLLFLDSEGSVVSFSEGRGWHVKDGRIDFPDYEAAAGEADVLGMSGQVIENTLGYARELETIV